MNLKYCCRKLLLFTFLFLYSSILFAQTIVSGTVTDAATKKTLPFVAISFTGTTIGVNTDAQGQYTISSNEPARQLKASFLGYKNALISIVPGKTQVFNIKLVPIATQLNEVVVKSGKKPKYRNKDNPAVELIRKVIENKEKNRPENYAYVEYKEYDKMQFSLLNVSNTLSDKKIFRQYKFMLDNRDSTTVPGKSLLPFFLDEKGIPILLSQRA